MMAPLVPTPTPETVTDLGPRFCPLTSRVPPFSMRVVSTLRPRAVPLAVRKVVLVATSIFISARELSPPRMRTPPPLLVTTPVSKKLLLTVLVLLLLKTTALRLVMGPVPRFPPVPPLPTCRMVPVALTVITPVKSLLSELVTINEPLPPRVKLVVPESFPLPPNQYGVKLLLSVIDAGVRVPTSETTLVVPRSSKVAKSPELYRSGLPELSQFVVMVSHKVGPATAPPRQFF